MKGFKKIFFFRFTRCLQSVYRYKTKTEKLEVLGKTEHKINTFSFLLTSISKCDWKVIDKSAKHLSLVNNVDIL